MIRATTRTTIAAKTTPAATTMIAIASRMPRF
jgi:hypothetical protein